MGRMFPLDLESRMDDSIQSSNRTPLEFGKRFRNGILATILIAIGLYGTGAVPAQAAPDVCSTPPSSPAVGAFVSCWDTRNTAPGSSSSSRISLPLVDPATTTPGSAYNFVVDWGDGSPTQAVMLWNDPVVTHTYENPGQYWVTITGTIQGFSFQGAANSGATADRRKLISVAQWGSLALGNSAGYFRDAVNVNFTATDAPNLSGTTDLGETFAGAASFNSPIGHWDVSDVESLRGMFSGATSFNQSLAAWDVSKVRDFGLMFLNASVFNQPIGTWATSTATDMSYMFEAATAFNQPLGSWNTSNVTNFESMFNGASSFNQNIQSWNTGSATRMRSMFSGATAFNQPLGGWNTSNVTDMGYMFSRASLFNQNIQTWNTRSATDMSGMFNSATAFNQPLNLWDTSNVTLMHEMFASATSFNQPLDSWVTSSVTNFRSMFASASSFNQVINTQSIGTPPTERWNTSSATDMSGMFSAATAFDQPLNRWNTQNVTDMSYMFFDAGAFNQDLGSWNTGSVRDLTWTFFRAFAFNNGGRPMDWDVRSVTSFSNTFEGTRAFNQDIGRWDIGRDPGVTVTMHSMFHDADAFNRDLSAWDMTAVTNTSSMFRSTALFNNGGVPLDWGATTGNITNMEAMFYGSEAFDQPINGWNTSNVTNMREMFLGTRSFNQPIGDWNTSNVTTMAGMFRDAESFQQDVSDWRIGAVTTMEDMFSGVSLPTSVYTAMLSEWAGQAGSSGVQTGVLFSAGNSGYLTSAATARSILTSAPNNWVITDGGLAPDTPTGFVAVPSDGEIAVSWNEVVGADSYEVTGTAAGGLGLSCQNVGSPPATTCSWTGLTNGVTYSFTLVAKNASGAPSVPTAPVTAAAGMFPAAPTITAITSGNRRLTVTFTAGDDGGRAITNYQYSTNGGDSWTTRSPASSTSPIVITGLTNGTSYNVRIRAVNAAGAGAESNQVAATPSSSAPPTPAPGPADSTPEPTTTPVPKPTPIGTPTSGAKDLIQSAIDEMRALTPEQIRTLSAAQVAAFPPEAFAVMTPAQARALRPSQVRAVNAQQVQAIDPTALGAMRPRTINGFTVRNIRALTQEQVNALRPKQIRALGPAKQAIIHQRR